MTKPDGKLPAPADALPPEAALESQPIAAAVESLSVSMMFKGPLPPPSLLREYDAIIPGAAERLMVLVESESLHRRDLEKRDMTLAETESQARSKDRRRLHWIGAAVAIMSAGGAVFAALWGVEWGAVAALAAIPASATLQYIFGRRSAQLGKSNPK